MAHKYINSTINLIHLNEELNVANSRDRNDRSGDLFGNILLNAATVGIGLFSLYYFVEYLKKGIDHINRANYLVSLVGENSISTDNSIIGAASIFGASFCLFSGVGAYRSLGTGKPMDTVDAAVGLGLGLGFYAMSNK